MDRLLMNEISRRRFVEMIGATGAAWGLSRVAHANAAESIRAPVDEAGEVIPGFERQVTDPDASEGWEPFSDRKIRVGIAGYGLCRFGAAFGFQDHPNVEVAAVSDLIPSRCAALATACRCEKTYPSCEQMIEDPSIEAVFIATDAPSHARLSLLALRRGKHVAAAVPAVWGRDEVELAGELLDAVRTSGLKYMMFETSNYHARLYAWHRQYQAGDLGKIIYSEGEYYHYFPRPLGGYNPATNDIDPEGWRKGLPPQWYPTHSNAYHIGVTGGSFAKVSCLGMPSILPHLRAENNAYKNPFGSEIALFRTCEGGMSRMAVCWDMPAASGEKGRVYGQKNDAPSVATRRPALPPGVEAGAHGGSHGHLMSEFVDAILRDRKPWIDVAQSLNVTVSGIIAHESALRDGEWMSIPQYSL